MAGMTWLHLSDWHQRGKDFDRDVVRNALIEDIKNRADIHRDLAKLDFIIFSGDVAFSGLEEEYQAALDHLLTPLLRVTGVQPKKIFFVPGNHDFDRDELKYLPEEIKNPFTTEAQVQSWLTDSKNRNHLLKPFMTYTNFVRRFTGQEDPAYASTRSFVVDGTHVTLLGLNSALMCGRNKDVNGEVRDQTFLTVGEPQVYNPLRQIAESHVRITVLHHPFDWLTEFDRDRVEGRLIGGSHFILCGHLHKPNIFIQQGMAGNCVIIPAGASYERRVASQPRYANSYNYVHLDFGNQQGTIYLRRWSDTRESGKWIEDVDSWKGGFFQFPFPPSLKSSLSFPPVPVPASHIGNEGDKADKPENLDGNNKHGGNPIGASVKGLPDTRRGCIVEAQEYVKKAYNLLNPKLNILPENVVDAVGYLKTAKRDIEQLRDLLRTDPPPKYARIFAEIDIVIDQVDNHLVPVLQPASPYKNAQNKFQTLREALDNLDTLIPR